MHVDNVKKIYYTQELMPIFQKLGLLQDYSRSSEL